jgi:hypothetical protein
VCNLRTGYPSRVSENLRLPRTIEAYATSRLPRCIYDEADKALAQEIDG